MTARDLVLKLHLILGATAAIFLVILGLTGAIIAFENDIDHWFSPGLFYVHGGTPLPESELIKAVETRFAPAHVNSVHIAREPNLVHAMQTSDRATVYVNQYTGEILGTRTGPSRAQRIVGYIHQFHTRLVPDPRQARRAADIGERVVEAAGLVLCLLVPTGLILWWRVKRARVKWSAQWFRICFDSHVVLGVYAALFLLIAAITGVLVAQENWVYSALHSPSLTPFPKMQSTPGAGLVPITADRAGQIAHESLPGTTVTDFMLPNGPKGFFAVILRVPEETSEAAHSYVFIDQFTGRVLYISNFLKNSPGYRAVRFNRSIHTGDVFGTTGHVIMSLSSLALVVMAITGLVIWLKKLAV
jgi:uncharacterized iron-regulated membrane protein